LSTSVYTSTRVAATIGDTTSPVVSEILSQPGTVNGHVYTNWSFLVNDGTGSLDVFASQATLQTAGYTPTMGDAVQVIGTYAPYHQIPEIGSVTAIGAASSGNAVPAPKVTTIPTINQANLPLGVAGYYLELDNVTISGVSGTQVWNNATLGNQAGLITDSSNNSMNLYYWPTSYSVASQNLAGLAIPTGLVDMTGFVSVYPGPPANIEFTPLTITPVPEPGTLVLLAAGVAVAAGVFVRRKLGK